MKLDPKSIIIIIPAYNAEGFVREGAIAASPDPRIAERMRQNAHDKPAERILSDGGQQGGPRRSGVRLYV